MSTNKFELPGVLDDPKCEDEYEEHESHEQTQSLFEDWGSPLVDGSEEVLNELLTDFEKFDEYMKLSDDSESYTTDPKMPTSFPNTNVSGEFHTDPITGTHYLSVADIKGNISWVQYSLPLFNEQDDMTKRVSTGAAEQMEMYEHIRSAAYKQAYIDAQKAYDEAIQFQIKNTNGISLQYITHSVEIDPSTFNNKMYVALKINDTPVTFVIDDMDMYIFRDMPVEGQIDYLRSSLSLQITNYLLENILNDTEIDINTNKLRTVMLNMRN